MMRKASLYWAFLASVLTLGMTGPARAQTNPTIDPTPNSNEVNLIDFPTTAPYAPGYPGSGGYNLSSSSPSDFTVSANNGTAGTIGPTNQQSIMDRLYGVGNYTLLNATATQTFVNNNGIALMATVKYAGSNENFGYFANGASGSASSAFKSILTVTGVSSAGFYSQGGLTVTSGGAATQVGTNSFLLTPSQSGSPFEFALFNGTNYYSSNQNSNVTGLTDQQSSPSGFNHLAVFQITGGTSAGAYVLAWEDGPASMPSDRDYNDLVVQIQYVPEPSTLAIAGLGALGLIGFGLRRRKSPGA